MTTLNTEVASSSFLYFHLLIKQPNLQRSQSQNVEYLKKSTEWAAEMVRPLHNPRSPSNFLAQCTYRNGVGPTTMQLREHHRPTRPFACRECRINEKTKGPRTSVKIIQILRGDFVISRWVLHFSFLESRKRRKITDSRF